MQIQHRIKNMCGGPRISGYFEVFDLLSLINEAIAVIDLCSSGFIY
jgi:hypothetical protein